MTKPKYVFLDRDGVLNYDRGDYSWLPEHFKLIPDSMYALRKLNDLGYTIIVITNQAGISRGIYTVEDMKRCHQLLQEACDHAIAGFYYSPYHPSKTKSLSRKPDSLLFERAIAKYDCDPKHAWMIGDKERDLIPADRLGMSTIIMGAEGSSVYNYRVQNLSEAVEVINSQEI